MLNRIANYEIEDRLGEGGMGEVFRARDVMLEREVAIKALRPELATHADVVERFRTEAVALAKLHHPNIAAVYNFIRENERCYIVMEYVDGDSLEAILRKRGSLPWTEAVALVRQALEGLEHAHRAGIVHRDIKPANIMVARDGTVKLMDFGIARILQTARLTREGHLVGTLEYMSPEQILGSDVDARADLYAMGIVLYQAVTGALPFQSSSDYDLIRAQVERQPAPPRTLGAPIPAALEAVLLRTLAKVREERFQSARELGDALAGVAAESGSAPAALAPPPPTRVVTAPSLHPVEAHPAPGSAHAPPAGLALLVLVAGAAIAGSIALTVRSLHPPPSPQGAGSAPVAQESAGAPEGALPSASADAPPPPAPSAQDTPAENALPPAPAATPSAPVAPPRTRPSTPAFTVRPAPVPTTPPTPVYTPPPPVCRARCSDTARACKSSCKAELGRGHDRKACLVSCEAIERECKARAPC